MSVFLLFFKLSSSELKFFYIICSIYLFFIYAILRRFFYIEDRNHDGFIDLTELLVAVRGDMNTRRTSLVKMAFNHLDTDKYVFQNLFYLFRSTSNYFDHLFLY